MYKGYKPKRLKPQYKPRRNVPKTALVSRVKRLEKKTSGIESKFIDFTNATAIMPTALSFRCPVEDIIQGDLASQRDGDSVTLTSVQARFIFRAHTAGDKNMARILIVHDKQTNGVLFTQAELFLDSSAQDIMVSPYNLDNKHRFRVLCDDYVEFNADGVATVLWKKYIKLNIKVRYDASTGAVGDLTSNSLQVVVVGFDNNNLGDLQSIIRLRYYDG